MTAACCYSVPVAVKHLVFVDQNRIKAQKMVRPPVVHYGESMSKQFWLKSVLTVLLEYLFVK